MSLDFSLWSTWNPVTLLVMFWAMLLKKATSKSSLNAINWKAVKLLFASLGGGGALEICPSASLLIAISCWALGLGNPLVEGTVTSRVTAGAALASPTSAPRAGSARRAYISKMVSGMYNKYCDDITVIVEANTEQWEEDAGKTDDTEKKVCDS